MKITIFCVWYSRHEDMTPDYDQQHHGTISADIPAECMRKFNAFKRSLDLNKYTIPTIEEMW